MKFQILAIAGLVLAICALGNAQVPASGLGPIGPPPFCQTFLNILQLEANKINTPDLPEDLKTRVETVLDNAALGCTNCEGLIVWANKVCLVVNFRTGLNQLSQIKTEADARATTVAAPVSPVQ